MMAEALPRIGLGTWQTFDAGAEEGRLAELRDVLGTFVTHGGRLVDTSPMYGRAETVLGELVSQLGIRERLFIATKVWTTGREAGIRQMEASMRKLRVDVVDLMQVHNLVDANTHLATLAHWKRDGRVRYVGVTHYTASAHDALADAIAAHDVDCLQVNYSVAERDAERTLLPLAAARGIAVIANRPFAEGRVLRRLRDRPLPQWAAGIGCASWPQLLLKFVVSHPAITCAIPATSSAAHLLDDLKAGTGSMPDAATRERIAEAAA